ncbi:MAG TPA: hypothetical protein VFK03_04535 [Candidatus Saccharimonadales bacterium]|nr:hypothetical protein [Candidatus Saccharimonadales bacterium]
MPENFDTFLGTAPASGQGPGTPTDSAASEFAKHSGARSLTDAKRLYGVANAIYVVLIVLNWVIGVCGVIFALVLFAQASNSIAGSGAGVLAGFVTLVVTAIFCAVNYAVAVLSTHIAKVLSNISAALVSEHAAKP